MIAVAKRKPRSVTEREVEQRVVATLMAYGCTVYRLSQGYRAERGGTRQTPGIPDLYWVHLKAGRAGWFETKTPKGLAEHLRYTHPGMTPPKSKVRDWQRAQSQKRFRDFCAQTGTPYAIGGVDEARALMERVVNPALHHLQPLNAGAGVCITEVT